VKKDIPSEAEDLLKESDITEKNKVFCREYILDWNGSRAYKVAYPNVTDGSARTLAGELLTKVDIQEYIKTIQRDLEKTAGISRLMVINEHMKLAFNSIAGLHNTWIERKEFENLTDEQKSCIAEIDTKIKREVEWIWNEETEKKEPVKYDIEYVRIKLYDKQKALDSISKMLGYDAATKSEIIGLPQTMNITVDNSETAETLKRLRDELANRS
jgi:phage terminase small subunit